MTRHFDVDESWFDSRQGSKRQSTFFEEPMERRAAACKEARGGGSVPPLYMDCVKELEAEGKLVRKLGSVRVVGIVDRDGEEGVEVMIGGKEYTFDVVVNACGHKPDCLEIGLLQDLHKREPIDIVGGFPALTSELQWGGMKNLYVVGALASLQVGPDAGNLMGLGRAAQIATDAIGENMVNGGKAFSKFKNSTRAVQGWYKTNRFEEAFDDGWSSSDDEDSDGEVMQM